MNTLCLLEHKIGFIYVANPFLPAGVLFNKLFQSNPGYYEISIQRAFTRDFCFKFVGALVGRMIDNMKLMLSPPDTTTEPVRKAYLYSAVSQN